MTITIIAVIFIAITINITKILQIIFYDADEDDDEEEDDDKENNDDKMMFFDVISWF